jgi:hypothetical protein
LWLIWPIVSFLGPPNISGVVIMNRSLTEIIIWHPIGSLLPIFSSFGWHDAIFYEYGYEITLAGLDGYIYVEDTVP